MPHSAASANAPPNAKHSSSGCATTHINFNPTPPPPGPYPQIGAPQKLPLPPPHLDPPIEAVQNSSGAARMVQTPPTLADAPASHIPCARPAHTPDVPHPVPASTHRDAPSPPLKPPQSRGSARRRRSASSAGTDDPAALHRSADDPVPAQAQLPPPASPSVSL